MAQLDIVRTLPIRRKSRGQAMSPAGRPEIGQPINIRLGDELLAAVDAKAHRLGISRAELIRTLLADRLADEMKTD
jgi:hypothetical protein